MPGNPCRDAGRPPKPKSRERVLSEKEIGALFRTEGYAATAETEFDDDPAAIIHSYDPHER